MSRTFNDEQVGKIREALEGIKSHNHTKECDSEHGYSFHANECLNCWPGRVEACGDVLSLLDAPEAEGCRGHSLYGQKLVAITEPCWICTKVTKQGGQ